MDISAPHENEHYPMDISAPHENEHHPSLNELIKEDYSLSYVTIDNAISLIKK